MDHHYAYDGNGNRTLKKQLEGEIKYHFDPLNQLHQVEYPSYREELFYDKAGNRTRRLVHPVGNSNHPPVEELYRYDAGNRLMELVKQGSVTSFAYDAAGNLLQDDRAAYTYDDFNHTVKAETFDGNIEINHYDAEGLRHEMEENGRLVQFIFNTEKEVVAETEGNVTNRLIRGSGLIARTTDAESARTYYHYAADEMGSITHLTDEDGKVLNRYGYDAWGNLTACEEEIENRFRYTGEQFDAITRQYYLRARFYNPVIARFTQEDTYRGDGLNLYAYCANNPVGYVDPSGHQPQCVKDAAEKYMETGIPKEIAYRKAYADLLNQKLQDADLSSIEKQKLLDKLSKTKDMSRVSDITIIEASKIIHEKQYGNKWWGKVNPISVTVGSDGTVVVTKNNGVIGKASQKQASVIFGDGVIIPKGRGTQYNNVKWEIVTGAPKHAEARGYQALLSYVGEESLAGAKQATTLPSCRDCQLLREGWNELFREQGRMEIINLTGDKSAKK